MSEADVCANTNIPFREVLHVCHFFFFLSFSLTYHDPVVGVCRGLQTCQLQLLLNKLNENRTEESVERGRRKGKKWQDSLLLSCSDDIALDVR